MVAYRFLGPDRIEEEIERTLSLLDEGHAPNQIETAQVDIKEEPGRRKPDGSVQPGSTENEAAAQYLYEEMACMANTPGGGAHILGIADDGARLGTELNHQWLRHRIWQISGDKLTVDVRVVMLGDCRLLVLSTQQTLEPIPDRRGRIKWRVNDNCVEVDPSTWFYRKAMSMGFDWSAELSGYSLKNVSLAAVEIARRFLRETQNTSGLADASHKDLIRRLNLVDSQDRLTNAGSLLFVGTPEVGIDYIRRDVPGGDSTNRIRGSGPLLTQVAEVEQASKIVNRMSHVANGFSQQQYRHIPPRALREAIVNGVIHRDWHSPQPTTVKHIGDTMTVTSPGGFVGEIHPDNIITHPAEPRYRSLAEAMCALGLAEREGIGVDRMIRDMLAIGRPRPVFTQIAGPYVRVSLLGGKPDPATVAFINATEPAELAQDVDLLLFVDHLLQHSWGDANSAAPILQRSVNETASSLQRIAQATSNDHRIIQQVKGVPTHDPPAYRLSDFSRNTFADRLAPVRTSEGREAIILNWAISRGRISSTEAADLTGIKAPYAGQLLKTIADRDLLIGSRPVKRGRGFHYLPYRPQTPRDTSADTPPELQG